jgi:hypothetical protein
MIEVVAPKEKEEYIIILSYYGTAVVYAVRR